MPLEEITPNIQKPVAQDEDKGARLAATTSTQSLRTNAVRSMLRNTTELGDTGLFAVRPSRIPRSASHLHPRRRHAAESDISFTSQRQRRGSPRRRYAHSHHGPRTVTSSSALSGRDATNSVHTSAHSNFRPKRAGNRRRPHDLTSPSASSFSAHPLHTHRSMVTLRTQRTFQSLHSGSPMLRPGQHPPHGYRASSPAFSDAYHFRGGPRRGYPRVGSANTVASSPALPYRPRPQLPGYRPELNNSFSSSVRLPSPAISFHNGRVGPSYPTQRTATPMSASVQSLRPSWNHSAASSKGLTKSPTESTAPHYYDYSESFLEEDCFSPPDDPAAADVPFTMDQTIMEDEVVPERRHAQSPFGTMPGSSFRPLELPTSHNRQPSEQSKHSKHSYTSVIPPRKSSLAATTGHQKSVSDISSSYKAIKHVAGVAQDRSEGRPEEDRDDRRASTTSRRASHSTRSSAFFPNACRSPRDLTTLAARVHSPVFDEKPSISGILEYETPYQEPESRRVLSDIEHIRTHWQLPSFQYRPLSFSSSSPGVKDRPKTASDARQKAPPEILSPMPERPMSSQSRKRFSRILELTDVAEASRDPCLPIMYSRLDAVEEHPDLQGLERSLRSPSEFEDKLNGPSLPDIVHTPDDRQISPGLNDHASRTTNHERSTIESLLDRHIECLGLGTNSDGVGGESHREDAHKTYRSPVRFDDGKEDMSQPPLTVISPLPEPSFRPTTSSSTIQHTSLASSERRRLIPRRLFASMDARLPAGATLADIKSTSASQLTPVTSCVRERLSGWQSLASTSGLAPSTYDRSTTKASLTSGDMADIDSDPPQTRLKIRKVVEASLTLERGDGLRKLTAEYLHRRSKSDIILRQESHQRRRARILLKAKRKSQSLGQLAQLAQEGEEHQDCQRSQQGAGDQSDQVMDEAEQSEGWTTEDSPDDTGQLSPVAGYADLRADSVAVQPPTMLSAEPSVLVPTSVPRRWTSMLAALPTPVKKSVEIARNTSVRTVTSQRPNTHMIELVDSTRPSCQITRVGSMPQLVPPDFGPPLTSSDLNLSLRFLDTAPVIRPPLRQVQSFFSDDSTAALAHKRPSTVKKRFDLHSFRSGFTKSTGLMGTRHSSTQKGTGTLQTSVSYRAGDRESLEYRTAAKGDTVPMSDFAYRKRKVLGRFKEWWKRQCMQKTLDLVRKRSGRDVKHAVWA